MKLNLDAKTNEERKVKAYLEANASEILAEKINNGVRIQKDGKTLLNRKTLAGFMKFACDEAKKQAEKGAHSACIDDDVVYGWAVHYFEEDSIEGTLYNEDGTEYKPPKPVTPSNPVTIYTTPKPQPKPQISLFELMENNATEEKASENTLDVSQKTVQPDNPAPDDEEPTEEELQEAAETEDEQQEPVISEKAKAVQLQGSPFYQRYMQVQDKYPDHIVLFSRGDFYEALGKGAQILSENLALTLTGRDCGLLERVPMTGISNDIAKQETLMANYFRITAYHPQKDVCAVLDSNGRFEKLWQFSAYLVQKGFKIVEVGSDDKFLDGNIPKASVETLLILRACAKGQPVINGDTVEVNGKNYKPGT